MNNTTSLGGEVETVPSTPEKTKDGDSKSPAGKIIRPWDTYLEENKEKWKELSIKGDHYLQENIKPN